MKQYLPLLLLLGCEVKEDDPSWTTPDGYHVTGEIHENSLYWIDLRIAEWIAEGTTQEDQLHRKAVAKGYTFQSIMDFHFKADESPTGYAAGIHYGPPLYLIGACCYTGGMYSLPTSGIGYPVIPHELDHSIGIGH